MPMLVRTPEEIFRAEKKDIYVLIDQEDSEEDEFMGGSSEPSEGLIMIKQWLKENMPTATQELLAPSEYSGVICGGIGRVLRVDFSPTQLKQFCDRWEINDKSVDPRFQCFIMPYQRWYEEHGRFVPTKERPTGIGLTVWWYTPTGFIHHQLDTDEAQRMKLKSHPANHMDVWQGAIELWPELAAMDVEKLTYGAIMSRPDEIKWIATYTPALWRQEPDAVVPTLEQIRECFQIPPEIELIEDSF